ncbi:hypothetical protein [Chryseobacterium sp. MA9]|uniref:hypothetical protein n=1 Tax=Chryseobacterium sp. MA9 TaxID=2966625 RepID=UPI0021051299|nr:hypothetical protein [Chryseobacterium sp. MA9]UTX48935.1 hypothetical protein KIK00_01305 [Chryseobacterium sp. MA9]
MFSPTEWVIPSAGFISKTSECDALIQNGAFFMELDAAAIMESIGKKGDVNPDAISSISSNRRFALVYKGEIIAQGSRYDKAYQKVLQDIRKVSYDAEKVGKILEEYRINAFCERIPKIANKYPIEELPKDGFVLEYKMDSQGVFRQLNDNIFPSREFDFVITKSGELRIGSKHHLLGNRNEVLAAGGVRFKNGKIVEFNNMSGHYRPTAEEAERLEEILNELEIPVKRARNEITPLGINSRGKVVRTGKDKIIYIQNIK